MKQTTRDKGFTLIELLVVVAIISLLTAVTLASLNTARARGQDAKVLAEYKQIQIAMEMFYNEHGRYPGVGTINGGNFCITNGCTLLGASLPSLVSQISAFNYKSNLVENTSSLFDQFAAVFSYQASSNISLGNSKGFIYSIPTLLAQQSGTQPSIIFPLTGQNAVKQATVGVWILSNTN
jgi:prepilin-type N-terminal cleavage/methylation domain-containing protein